MDLPTFLKPSTPTKPSAKPTTPSIALPNLKLPSISPPSRNQPPQPPPPRALPPELSIEPLTAAHLHSFRRITSLLLPIRYPDKFYSEIIADATVSSLSRVAVWGDLPRPGKRKRDGDGGDGAENVQKGSGDGKVVGGIRCRLEDVAVEGGGEKRRVYVQTLCLLSPYRALGIGTALLDAIVQVGIKQYGITSIYAHVWEANTEALEWYRKRGFEVGDVEQGYYRRLKPDGARIVRRKLGIRDYLAVERCPGNVEDDQGDEGSARVNAQNAGAGSGKVGPPRLDSG